MIDEVLVHLSLVTDPGRLTNLPQELAAIDPDQVEQLVLHSDALKATWDRELRRQFFEGGGHENESQLTVRFDDLRQLDDRAMQLLTEVGLDDLADEVTVNLPYGRKRALEIATTLSMEPELMLLDEPTQGMGHEDVDRVTQLIKKVSANRTVLMVEHNMNVVASIADTISVLQRGQVIAEGSYDVVSTNPQVLEAYMGSTDAALSGGH